MKGYLFTSSEEQIKIKPKQTPQTAKGLPQVLLKRPALVESQVAVGWNNPTAFYACVGLVHQGGPGCSGEAGSGGGQGRATSPLLQYSGSCSSPYPYWGRYAKIGQGAWMGTIRDAGAPYWVMTRAEVLLQAAGGCKPTWVYGWCCRWFCMVRETGARFSSHQSSVHVTMQTVNTANTAD